MYSSLIRGADFTSQFSDWLQVAHPEVASEMEYLEGTFPAVASVTTALEHVDEYVAFDACSTPSRSTAIDLMLFQEA